METAAKQLGLDYKFEKVTDIEAIMQAGIMSIPALIVDGEMKSCGKVPSVDELKKMLA